MERNAETGVYESDLLVAYEDVTDAAFLEAIMCGDDAMVNFLNVAIVVMGMHLGSIRDILAELETQMNGGA